ncbi:MAG: hypothetical protein AB1422_00630 [bacterium]
MKKIQKIIVTLFAILLPVGIVGSVLWLFWRGTHPPLQQGQEIYAREIYILIDTTASMDGIAPFLDKAKYLIIDHIFPELHNLEYIDFAPLGPGDQIFCYTIGTSTFDEFNNSIFKNQQSKKLPPVPQNVLKCLIEGKDLPQEWKKGLKERWVTVEKVVKEYREKIQELHPAEGGFSAYLGALNYISKRFRYLQEHKDMKEKFIIVVGDMHQWQPDDLYQQEPESKSFTHLPLPIAEEQNIFHTVKVWLVYPAGVVKPPEKENCIHDFWKQYFLQRGCKEKDIYVMSFDGFNGIPHNQVPLIKNE